MKTISYFAQVILFTILLSGCSITNRRYMHGFYLDKRAHQVQSNKYASAVYHTSCLITANSTPKTISKIEPTSGSIIAAITREKKKVVRTEIIYKSLPIENIHHSGDTAQKAKLRVSAPGASQSAICGILGLFMTPLFFILFYYPFFNLAILYLIIAVLIFLFITIIFLSILAILYGINAIQFIKKSPDKYYGMGKAIVGIIMGCVIVIPLLYWLFSFLVSGL